MTPDDREKRIRARAEDDTRLFPEAAAEEWPHAAHDRPFLLAALDEARTALTLERETSAALAEQCRGLAETLRSVAAERTEARRERDENEGAARLLAEAHRKACEERDALRAALTEACDGWENACSYKMDYLVKKHGDLEDIARLRALLPEPGK